MVAPSKLETGVEPCTCVDTSGEVSYCSIDYWVYSGCHFFRLRTTVNVWLQSLHYSLWMRPQYPLLRPVHITTSYFRYFFTFDRTLRLSYVHVPFLTFWTRRLCGTNEDRVSEPWTTRETILVKEVCDPPQREKSESQVELSSSERLVG